MVHSGFLEAAKWFMDNICNQLLIFAKEYEAENIFITGHSLGGSVGAMTTMLLVDTLKKENCWPLTPSGKPITIRCIAYGMAPVCTRNLCEDYLENIDVFVNGEDIVPRLSYGSFIDFQIFLVYATEIGLHKGVLTDELIAKLDACRKALRIQDPPLNLKLFLPGKIHHLIKFRAPNDQHYIVADTASCDRFPDWFITRKMLSHHMPGKYEAALDGAYLELLEDEIRRNENSETKRKETIEEVIQHCDESAFYPESVDSDLSFVDTGFTNNEFC